MSRSGYTDEGENWDLIRWRGAVNSATKGKRGQQFFKDLLAALDAMPEKRLIADSLEDSGQFCTLGALAHQRGMDVSGIDPEDATRVAGSFGIAEALAREVVFMNDEGEYSHREESPEQRWERMRKWVAEQIQVQS